MLISVCIVVRDSSHLLSRSLYSIRELADEIIVVDRGSYDQTVRLAQEQGARVYQANTANCFQSMNYALEQAKGQWILFLEAGEEIVNCDRQLRIILESSSSDGFYLPVIRIDFNQDIELPRLTLRLFKKQKGVLFPEDSYDISKSILAKKNDASIKALQLPIIKKPYFVASGLSDELKPEKLYYLELTQGCQPDSPSFSYLKEGVEYYWKDELQLALESFEQGYQDADKTNRLTFLKNAIFVLLELKQFRRANEKIKKALEDYPDNVVLYFWQGYVDFFLHKFNSALINLKKILSSKAMSKVKSNAYLMLGIIYQHLNDQVLARFYLEKAYSSSANDFLSLYYLLDYLLIDNLYIDNNSSMILDYLQHIKKRSKKELGLSLLKVYFRKNQLEKARQLINMLLKIEGSSDELLFWYAKVLIKLQQHRESSRVLKKISLDYGDYEKVLELLWIINITVTPVKEESRSVLNQIKLLGNKLAWNVINLFNQLYFYEKEVWFQFNSPVSKLRFYRKAIYYLGLITEYGGRKQGRIMIEIIKSLEIGTMNRDLGTIFYQKGNWEEAETYLRLALEQGKTLPELWCLTDILSKLKKDEEANSIKQEIKEIDPDFVEPVYFTKDS